MKLEPSGINSKDTDILFLSAVMPGTEKSLNLEFDPQLKINRFYLNRALAIVV